MHTVKRWSVILLLILALPARMVWADIMPLKMAQSALTATTAAVDEHAHCHGEIDEISSIDTMTDASGGGSTNATANPTGDPTGNTCGKCPACHGLAVVVPATLQSAARTATIRVATTPSAWRSAETVALDKPPIS